MKYWLRWYAHAGLWRAWLYMLLFNSIFLGSLLLLVEWLPVDVYVLMNGGFFIIGISAVVFGLSLAFTEGGFWRKLLLELAAFVLALISLTLLGSFVSWYELSRPMSAWQDEFYIAFPDMLLFFSIHNVTFIGTRCLMWFWRWWNRLRKRSLLWTLTHDQLTIVFVLMVIFGVTVAGLSIYMRGNELANSDNSTTFLIENVVQYSLLGSIYGALMIVGLFIFLPVAMILSYMLIRRVMRRIEALAMATTALRNGDYSSRIVVHGNDEIAQLQANFNAMAEQLDTTVNALKTERDRVAGLLDDRRALVASVSHELRTPVATMRGYLESSLHAEQGLTPQIQRDLLVMERETLRLQQLIEDLFLLSASEVSRLTLNREAHDLAPLINRIVQTVQPLAWRQSRVDVLAECAAELDQALIDPQRFEQILRNLLHNALRYTPPGGLVVVQALNHGDQIEIYVRDTGAGIDPAELDSIWQRFYRANDQANEQHQGAGLGLALVKELSEAMGGSVAVESQLGVGTSFCICFPKASKPMLTSIS
ncbi:ATP-binding protein [Herpetosiphon sp. NSE202]|uniref:ATP-binding protein n=1 Tax=Herpetosiphon sp. NSE202 TaxID=3351349 RepID=UPI00363A6070